MHLKKDNTDAYVFKLSTEIQDKYHDYIMGTEFCDLAAVFPSDEIISLRLPDSASNFTAEVGNHYCFETK